MTLHRELGQFHFAREALAGRGRVALAQGDLAQAQALVAELLPQLTIENLYGEREPFRVYLTCCQVLRDSQDPRAEEILAKAHDLLQARAQPPSRMNGCASAFWRISQPIGTLYN